MLPPVDVKHPKGDTEPCGGQLDKHHPNTVTIQEEHYAPVVAAANAHTVVEMASLLISASSGFPTKRD